MATLRIFVDADACPVKKEIIAAASEYGVETVFVASYAHRLNESGEGVTLVQVDPSDQSADMYIANRIRSGDVLVTGDYGLAALALAKGAQALSNSGLWYTSDNIDHMLDRRHAHMKLRRRGKYGKGPKPFTDKDRNDFLQSLTKLLGRCRRMGTDSE